MNIERSTESIAIEIAYARENAHKKHGEKSIEAVNSMDRFNSILVEEVGEVSKAMNEFALGNLSYSEFVKEIRSELIDTLAVATAWVAMIDSIDE